jgi:ABC-type nitrate/sulfonate/bicarbonate transport system ATPase subunit
MHKKQSTQIDITTNFQNKDNNSISIRNLNINFDSKILYKDFSIDFQENKITALLAPSGAGKTTLLKAISKQEQNSSFLFQNPRLLPWKTILENITLPLENTNLPKKEILKRGEFFLSQVGLIDRKNDYPKNLSGGEKQRVAMARAFAYPSSLLLMDEAFQSQDLGLKLKLMEEFLTLTKTENKTVILVTHDIREAICLANRLLVLKGSPNQIAMDMENPLSSENHSIKEKYISKKSQEIEEKILTYFL